MKLLNSVKFDSRFPRFSIDEWNNVLYGYLLKYFESESSVSENKDLLRVEILNFIKLKSATEYFNLFEEIFGFYISVLEKQNDAAMKMLHYLLPANVEVDAMWIGLVNRFPSFTPDLDPRDAIAEKFEVIETVLESVYKPRLLHLYRFATMNSQGGSVGPENISFGNIVDRFPENLFGGSLLFRDPIYGIAVNQWRNILCHKSYILMPDKLLLKYGNTLQNIAEVKHEDVNNILHWIDFSYCALRLAQVLIYLRMMPDLLSKFGTHPSLSLRFDSVLFGILHNIELVGFEYRSHCEVCGVFELSLYPDSVSDIYKSAIHSTQFFDQLALGINSDDFYRDRFQEVCIKLYSKASQSMVSCALAKISDLLDRMDGRISLAEQISRMNLSFNGAV
jgi:hypothetical protein